MSVAIVRTFKQEYCRPKLKYIYSVIWGDGKDNITFLGISVPNWGLLLYWALLSLAGNQEIKA